MDNKEMSTKINSVRLCMMAHPDNQPDSEFSDRIDDLVEIQNQLKTQDQPEPKESDKSIIKSFARWYNNHTTAQPIEGRNIENYIRYRH